MKIKQRKVTAYSLFFLVVLVASIFVINYFFIVSPSQKNITEYSKAEQCKFIYIRTIPIKSDLKAKIILSSSIVATYLLVLCFSYHLILRKKSKYD